MTDTFRVTIDTGRVYMPKPTGRWECDDRGFLREVYTDCVIVNADGTERSREPFQSPIGLALDRPPAHSGMARAWLAWRYPMGHNPALWRVSNGR